MPGLKTPKYADIPGYADTTDSAVHDDLLADIKNEYGINVQSIVQGDANNYTIYSDRSKFYLQRSCDREADIIFSANLHGYVKKRGLNNLLRLYQTGNGKYYICRPEGIYLLFDFIDTKDIGFSFKDDGHNMMKLMTDFYKASSGYIPPPGGKGRSCWGVWIEEYKKELLGLKRYRDKIKANDVMTPFEIMFVSDCDLFIDRVENSISLLKRGKYLDIVEDSMEKHQVCMGSFKQSNFYSTGHRMNIRSLKKCRYDIVEKDVAEFAGKFLNSYAGHNIDEIAAIIDKYHSALKLRDGSMKIIKAFLLFPDEYIKVCSKYFKDGSKSQGEYMDKLRDASNIDNKRAKLAYRL